MKKTIYFLVLFLFAFHSAFAQKKLMLYTNGDSYLTLKAESFLEELVDKSNIQTKDSVNKIVEVINLNRLIKINGIQTDINSTIHTFNPYGFLTLNKKDEGYLNEISEAINSCDLFLNINVNTFEDIIEYQLELFEYNKMNVESKGEVKYLKLINHNLIGRANFFIDPRNDNYLVRLNNGIRSLFRNTDFIPKPVIYVNNEPFVKNKPIYWGLNDELIMDASQSEDLDHDYKNLTFEWALPEYNGKKPNEFQKIGIQKNSSVQNILFPSVGKYKIGIKIWDGIAYSQEDSITVEVINNPVQYLKYKSYHFIKQGTYFGLFTSKLREKAMKLENRPLNNYISTSTGNSNLTYSALNNNKSTTEFLEKRVETAVRKGTKKNTNSIVVNNGFKLTGIDTLSYGVFKHKYEMSFRDPGSYWVTAFDEKYGVRSKIDTIGFNYYYKLPIELDLLIDQMSMRLDSVPEGLTSSIIGVKLNFLKVVSFDFQVPILLNKSSLDIKKISAYRYGISTRFSNSLFKLFPSQSFKTGTYPLFDGYLGLHVSDISVNQQFRSYSSLLLTSGLKYSPHKKVWNKNQLLEYSIGFTANLSKLGDAHWLSDVFGFQFGISYGLFYFNN